MADKRATMQPIEETDPDEFIDQLYDEDDPAMVNDPLIQIIRHIYDTLNALIANSNTNNGQVDRMTMTGDIDLDTMASEVTENTAKTGITNAQASAITANTAKTGISSAQASAITANTAKTGISSAQASAITANITRSGLYYENRVFNFSNTASTKLNFLPVKGLFEESKHSIDKTDPYDATIFDICGFVAPRNGRITRVAFNSTTGMTGNSNVVFTKWLVSEGSQKASVAGEYSLGTGSKGIAGNVGAVMDLKKISAGSGNNTFKEGAKLMFGLQFPSAPDDVCVTIEFSYDV